MDQEDEKFIILDFSDSYEKIINKGGKIKYFDTSGVFVEKIIDKPIDSIPIWRKDDFLEIAYQDFNVATYRFLFLPDEIYTVNYSEGFKINSHKSDDCLYELDSIYRSPLYQRYIFLRNSLDQNSILLDRESAIESFEQTRMNLLSNCLSFINKIDGNQCVSNDVKNYLRNKYAFYECYFSMPYEEWEKGNIQISWEKYFHGKMNIKSIAKTTYFDDFLWVYSNRSFQCIFRFVLCHPYQFYCARHIGQTVPVERMNRFGSFCAS